MLPSYQCEVPGCRTISQGKYTGQGPYYSREVCALHTAALHVKNPTRKNNRRA